MSGWILVATLCLGAAAQDDVAALVREGEAAERAADPRRALEAYRRAIVAAPTSRLARRAEARRHWIEARSEGEFAPLASLLRLQQLRPAEVTRERIAAFEREVASFPRGRVRREARAVIAGAWLDRIRDARAAERAHRAWLAEPDLEPTEERLATAGLARSRAALGDVRGGAETLERAGFGGSSDARALRDQARREVGETIAYAVLLAFLVLAMALGGWRGLRPAALKRALTPARVALAAWTLVVPALLAREYDHATEDTFVVAGLLFAAVLLVAGIAGAGLVESEAPRGRRIAVAAGAAAAALAAGYLALGYAGSILGIAI